LFLFSATSATAVSLFTRLMVDVDVFVVVKVLVIRMGFTNVYRMVVLMDGPTFISVEYHFGMVVMVVPIVNCVF
jgi:hypothetical protein